MRAASYDDLNQLGRGIRKSFVHLETRDAYGRERPDRSDPAVGRP
jgi:hypothetical protein